MPLGPRKFYELKTPTITNTKMLAVPTSEAETTGQSSNCQCALSCLVTIINKPTWRANARTHTHTGHKSQRQFIAHGVYSSTANRQTKIPVTCREKFENFRDILEFVLVLIATFLAKPPTIFGGTLVRKYWLNA